MCSSDLVVEEEELEFTEELVGEEISMMADDTRTSADVDDDITADDDEEMEESDDDEEEDVADEEEDDDDEEEEVEVCVCNTESALVHLHFLLFSRMF